MMVSSAWIFQGNPNYYNIVDYVREQNEIIWSVKQYKKHIKAGDRVYIWISGHDGGIIAKGITTSNPELKMKLDDEYALLEENYQEYLGVDIKITDRSLEHPFSRMLMIKDPRLADLTIFKMSQGTNFKITNEQADLLDSYFEADPRYSEEQFLQDVFISQSDFKTLKGLLRYKKNLILEGPPGVGKSYAARRLAYALMGAEDQDRVAMIQFHQNYSYEDFICGYRPSGKHFQLVYGPFYQFCKRAAADHRDYYFIIDEINRGNLSKIFGELLLLIEPDKRGSDHEIQLLYTDQLFSVPENVHIIGMMNTADRSLAMIDYALRRRFAFFPIKPAFDSLQFIEMIDQIDNPKVKKLIDTVKQLNHAIEQDGALGNGFLIGHSYFCGWDRDDDQQLALVIEYELIPLIREYWFDDPDKAGYWAKELRGVLL